MKWPTKTVRFGSVAQDTVGIPFSQAPHESRPALNGTDLGLIICLARPRRFILWCLGTHAPIYRSFTLFLCDSFGLREVGNLGKGLVSLDVCFYHEGEHPTLFSYAALTVVSQFSSFTV